ncbi:hypothetical protein RCG23_13920 [Neobacillus sp. PS3-34]|uniref:hypothetical protein n=1 Tax=Neobacillus sp. PS3-34 TaxID=3070678 RepID=UPI0027DF8C0F|nr:hypothetical protein [Neobacillus sp. PS3-34]WML46739.1 hypothetical protein RCG23_13920 [Neobacillus sp. PS3-34]
MTKEGVVGQLNTFLRGISMVPQGLMEEGTFIVDDDEIDKCLIFSLSDNIVTFAICRNEFTFRPWKKIIYYDGVTVSQSQQIPQTNRNMIDFEQFKQGLRKSIGTFLKELIEKIPNIKNDNDFIDIKSRVESI